MWEDGRVFFVAESRESAPDTGWVNRIHGTEFTPDSRKKVLQDAISVRNSVIRVDGAETVDVENTDRERIV